ncbi:MAG: hypothetical protein AVO38_10670 [delta proteobacterium ML8_D]|nr:MAG: hypothetical protein AVO38_10670 [delta proteobacterium ML8_D]
MIKVQKSLFSAFNTDLRMKTPFFISAIVAQRNPSMRLFLHRVFALAGPVRFIFPFCRMHSSLFFYTFKEFPMLFNDRSASITAVSEWPTLARKLFFI